MKQLIRTYGLKSVMLLLIANLFSLVILAQDSGSTTTTTSTSTRTTSSENWYTSPWVWVAGAAVFILLLIALLRGGGDKNSAGRTDRVTVTKTTRTDTD